MPGGTEICIDFTKDEAANSDWNSNMLPCPVCTRRVDDNLRLGFAPLSNGETGLLHRKKKSTFAKGFKSGHHQSLLSVDFGWGFFY
jgi:hypothetical protein